MRNVRNDNHRMGCLGSIFHAYIRGLDRKPLFHDDRDRNAYLLILAQVLAETGTQCLAFALMGNHVHLLLRTISTPLSKVMHRINLRYALYHNRRHGGRGHVFEGRFRSVLVETEEHLLTVLAYIHLNPVRAGLVPDEAALADYPWTGHAGLLGRRPQTFLAAAEVLRNFGADPATARQELRGFVRSVLRARPGAAASSVRADPELPDALPLTTREAEDFQARHVEGVLGATSRLDDELRRRHDLASARRRLLAAGWDEAQLLRDICEHMGVSPAPVRRGSRRRCHSRARALFLHLATELLGMPRRTAARYVGVTGGNAVGACERGELLAREPGAVPTGLLDAAGLGRDDEGEWRLEVAN